MLDDETVQTITWTNDKSVLWRIYALSDLSDSIIEIR